MNRQQIQRRLGAFAVGGAFALLLVACAQFDEPAPAGPPAAGNVTPALPGPLPAPAPLPGVAPEESYVVVPYGGDAGVSDDGSTEYIVVTGTRIQRSDYTSTSATVPVTAEDMRQLGVTSIAEMVEQLPGNVATAPAQQGQQGPSGSGFSAGADIDKLRELNAEGASGASEDALLARQQQERLAEQARIEAERQLRNRLAEAPLRAFSGGGGGIGAPAPAQGQAAAAQPRLNDGANARSPLSRVSPGEELWIISQPAADEMLAAVPEDALGPGVMIARFLPAVVVDVGGPPPVLREIPLPLKHTDVDAKVQGYVGTVDVTQQFENPYSEKIEAVYLFPLPEKAAVSEFVMTIGERRIRGILRDRQQAQQIYAEARAQGYQASLLTQHRPNVFEQKVANIEPGKQIDVNIRYYETLAYQDGWYSFVFPTVVGPRYNPPGSTDPLLAVPQTNWQPLPDSAVRYLTPGTTSAHDISIAVELDAGVAIEELDSSHEIESRWQRNNVVRVSLKDGATRPDKDFRLAFRVAGEQIKSNLLTHVDEESGDGYFTLMLYPPAGLEQLRRQPLELVFVLDCSGSMSGAPLQQAKSAILAALDRLDPNDSFQIIRFSQSASQFGPRPVPATPENIRMARDYVYGLQGSGGTQMIEGIRAALAFPHDEERLRFVTFLTDGFIGNETEILGAIDARLGASRIFSFGVGSAPNRYLLERMAGIGRGAVAWLSLEDSGRVVMDAFFDRISHPAMIDVAIDFGDMAVSDVFPRRLPDLFVGRPVVVTGRFTGRPGNVELSGRAGGARLAVALERDRNAIEHPFLPNLWARLKIAELEDTLAIEPARAGTLAAEIRQTALDYELMSDYTAFVAVDASQITAGASGTTVYQAVPVPAGTRYETTVGNR